MNVVSGTYNDGSSVNAEISVWGRTDGDWTALATERITIEEKEHKHLYFTLPPGILSRAFPGEEIEEVEICISDIKPDPLACGKLIFVN